MLKITFGQDWLISAWPKDELSNCWHTRNRDEDQWQYSHWWPKFNFKYVVPVTSSLLTVQSVKWICRICRGTSVSLSRHGYRRWINWLVLLNWKVFHVHYALRKIQKKCLFYYSTNIFTVRKSTDTWLLSPITRDTVFLYHYLHTPIELHMLESILLHWFFQTVDMGILGLVNTIIKYKFQ